MRVVIQRVRSAQVRVADKLISSIGAGLVILLGIEESDSEEDIQWLTSKIANLRIFNDHEGKMNRSIRESQGEAMVVSQFTLFASTKKGNRPSYTRAAAPSFAQSVYDSFIHSMEKELSRKVATGIFGADMQIELINDGPVTILIDTKHKE